MDKYLKFCGFKPPSLPPPPLCIRTRRVKVRIDEIFPISSTVSDKVCAVLHNINNDDPNTNLANNIHNRIF